jgi:phosphorylcholine metabolism protein LicD
MPMAISETEYNDLLAMLVKVVRLLEEHHISYFIVGGTLLGAVRHQGMIPWDDDIDLGVFLEDRENILSLKDDFNSRDLDVTLSPGGSYIKVFKNGNNDPFHITPFIDIFVYEAEDELVVLAGDERHDWPYDMFTLNALFPLKHYKFDVLDLMGPNDHVDYLSSVYGSNWETAYRVGNHQIGCVYTDLEDMPAMYSCHF